MLKRGIIIVAVILLIALLTYFNPSITSLGFLSFNKEKDEIVYAADILNVNILNAQIISQNQIKVLIENKESIKLRLFIKVEGDKGIDSYYDTGLLEAKSTKYLTITFNKDKTGNFIKKINIIPYLQLENKKIVYKFSETSIQINKQISAEEISQETSLDSQILTTSQQRESTYIYGNGLIASLDDQGNIQYYHKDNLGSIRAITDDTGSIIYSTSYDPFGNKFDETSYSSYTYTGKQQDNTGLYYYGARYYDANLGRFTQLDPILSADDSPYVYVSNNPLKFVDPTGMWYEEEEDFIGPRLLPHLIDYYSRNNQGIQEAQMESPSWQEEVAVAYLADNVYISPIRTLETRLAEIGQNYKIPPEEVTRYLESHVKPIEQTILSVLSDERYTYRTGEAIVREVQKKYPKVDRNLINAYLDKGINDEKIYMYVNKKSGEMYYRKAGHTGDLVRETHAKRLWKIIERSGFGKGFKKERTFERVKAVGEQEEEEGG